MAFGDQQYQINDLNNRIKILERQAKASPTQALPYTPLTVATSTGQSVTGTGGTQDAYSRSLSTAILSSFAGSESVEDSISASVGLTFTGGVQLVLHDTAMRPDPAAGDSYRLMAGGKIINNTATAGSLQFSLVFGGSPTIPLTPAGAFVLSGNDSHAWFLQILITVVTAGSSGVFAINSRATDSVAGNVNIPLAVGGDFLLDGTSSCSTLAPHAVLLVTPSFGSANLTMAMDTYLYERIGFRQA